MKIRILGCGAATGVPSLSGGWGRCDPANPKNRRRRPSILVEQGDTRILVDTTPDLREQLLDAGVRSLNGVLYTHAHADHVHGIDDLREINRAMKAGIPVYAEAPVLDSIRHRFDYAFVPFDAEKYSMYKPLLEPCVIDGPFRVGEVDVLPFEQDHGYVKTTGFRFGRFAYSTDVIDLPEAAFDALAGVTTWVVGCLMEEPHQTHAHLDKVLGWIERIRPRRTILTHMSVRLDFDALAAVLPPGVEPACDGLEIEV